MNDVEIDTAGATPRRAPGIVVEDFDDELLLLDPATEHVCALNPTGAAVWDLADGVRDVEDIARAIADAARDATADDVVRDVAAFVAELLRLGFFRHHEASATDGLPHRVRAVIVETDEAWQAYRREVEPASEAFMPSDPAQLVPVLAAMRPYVSRFVELGAGLGGVTLLASTMGYERAVGIEVDAELCGRAARLSESLASTARFVNANFVPGDFEIPTELRADEGFVADGPDLAGKLDLAEFDCWFAAPWPGVQGIVNALFDARAPEGAVLLIYTGSAGVFVRRADGSGVMYDGPNAEPALRELLRGSGE